MNDAQMRAILARQRAVPAPDARLRRDRLSRAIALLVNNGDALAEAMRADFGHRSVEGSRLTDIAGAVAALAHARDRVARWMKPERRGVSPPILGWLGARAFVQHVPKGVVGVISPWNFPVNLTFAPLAGVLAAGNTAMIKPSEFTPTTSALMARLIAAAFDSSEVTVITGGADVGQAFARLPFDHLLFTGSTATGKLVAQAAAENLVPLTLELGGKSPVILGRGVNMTLAATRIMAGKLLNAGQACIAPDYALAPRARIGEFAMAAEAAVAKMFPTLRDNPDYGAVINARHYERLLLSLEDARAKGARVVTIDPAGEDFTGQPFRKIPPSLVLDATEAMRVMQEEIFGPILPVIAYDRLDEALAFVRARPRPLAAYFFGPDAGERARFLSGTVSGGVAIDDVMMHFAVEDLPFGGIGPSGMGAYHGIDGFRTFSHARAVYRQTKTDVAAALRPPYGEAVRKYLAGIIGR